MSDGIRVLIVDDLPIMREAIRSVLSSDPSIEVVGMAKDADDAVQKTVELKPQVITMDIGLPGRSGLEAIKEIMDVQPTPIIVLSSMDVKVIVKSLGIGAMDFVKMDQSVEAVGKELIGKIKIASKVKPMRHILGRPPKTVKKEEKRPDLCRVVAIGVSTGGPQALAAILSGLPADFPAALVIVQHMTAGFIGGLAEWLASNSGLDIRVAKAGERLKNSTVYLAPDVYNIRMSESSSIVLSEPMTKMTHVPSIDVMMESVAEACGSRAIGVILTGMGRDGVEGMKAIKKAGGVTIAQDEKSSAVFGMNKMAIDSGCVDMVVPLERIAQELTKLVL